MKGAPYLLDINPENLKKSLLLSSRNEPMLVINLPSPPKKKMAKIIHVYNCDSLYPRTQHWHRCKCRQMRLPLTAMTEENYCLTDKQSIRLSLFKKFLLPQYNNFCSRQNFIHVSLGQSTESVHWHCLLNMIDIFLNHGEKVSTYTFNFPKISKKCGI